MTAELALSPVELRLVRASMTMPGATQEELAREVGVTSRYVRELQARPHVRLAMDAAAREALRATAATLNRGADRAAAALVRMATGPDRATSARVAAAKAVVALALRLEERDAFAERLAALEAALSASTAQKGSLQ